jgi:carbonic anhydrase
MPAITDLKDFKGAKEYSNEDYITKVTIQNVMNVVKVIKMKSPLLRSMIYIGTLKIVSAGYDLENGGVTFLPINNRQPSCST